MSKIGVAVCGNSGIDYFDHDEKIRVFRSLLLMGEEEYEDYVDISADSFYERIVNEPELDVKTAQTSTGVIKEMYDEMIEDGFDELIVITISKELSGTYQNAVLAAKMVDVPVHLFDSKSVSYVEASMAIEAQKMVDSGYDVDAILKRMEYLRDHNHIYVTVHTLKYLVKNGRLSNAAGFFGSLMKLKPLLEITDDGKVVTKKKIRTTKKARKMMFDIFYDEIEGKDVEVFLIYTNNKEEIKAMRDEMLEHDGIDEVKLIPLTPVVGCHAGPGTMGLGYLER